MSISATPPPQNAYSIEFSPSVSNYPELPIFAHFRSRPHCAITLSGFCRDSASRLMGKFGDRLLRMRGKLDDGAVWEDLRFDHLVFEVEPGVFLDLQADCLTIHAETRDVAKRWGRTVEEGVKPSSTPRFFILRESFTGAEAEVVRLDFQRELTPDELVLHYGEDFPAWEEQFLARLSASRQGASLLRGEPGTGKTSFLRHLIVKLRETHVFYYLPTRMHTWLSSPEVVNFWAEERECRKAARRVLIVEDAEVLLAERSLDNRNAVADILNCADGLLGDFLDLHILFTVNCGLERLDPAVLRQGRMIAFHAFGRLGPAEAGRLAAAKGLGLQPQHDYSLAEIYHGAPLIKEEVKPVGFEW